MVETRSLAALNEKYDTLSFTYDQREQEIRGIHQKIDTMTSVLRTLTETVQGLTKSGNQWQNGTAPSSPATTITPLDSLTTPLDSLTTVPKTMRLEFPTFRGENPSSWVYKAH